MPANGDLPIALRPVWMAGRVPILGAVHLLAFAAVFAAAFQFRFDFDVPPEMKAIFRHALAWLIGTKLAVFIVTGCFYGWWRYVTFADLAALGRATTFSLASVAAIDYIFIGEYQIPRSVLLIDFGLTILVFGGLKSVVRLTREHFAPLLRRDKCVRAIFVGADDENASLAVQIHANHRLPYRLVGFVDEDPLRHGSRIGGLPVLGDLTEVHHIAKKHRAELILVVAGSISGPTMRELISKCDSEKLQVKVLPPFNDLLNAQHTIVARDVDINDLLRREPIELNSTAISAMLRDQTVMVTGAGGSIGSEICRQLLQYNPKELVLVEHSENCLFFIERELRADFPDTKFHPKVADIRDHDRMEHLFKTYRPDVVFHAAAHKHVPMMELNVGEAVKNNVLGTRLVADLAHQYEARTLVLISTDKAVNPTSVMGVCKQLAERYVHSLSQESKTRFVVVRFGNVLGSNGSVVPLFQEQIRRGGPITITDERMTRYFMTIPEASQLVLQAATMGNGGEIFCLDMGEPVKIVDLARQLIKLSGLPQDAIDIVFTGIRPGEKLYEELYFDEEQTLPTPHPKVRAAYHRPFSVAEVNQAINELFKLRNHSDDVIRLKLHELVPEYCVDAEALANHRQPHAPRSVTPQPSAAACISATELARTTQL